ncbi:MAG: hypothetical protein H0X54_11260 [Propionibacteriales bacterium]|nr:hypothetical protein [Actinomycetota bacterium]MBA3991592.1 hypothetical protein [Propionibacteriales bacterium]
MSKYLNLDQVGVLTQAGQQYHGNAEDNLASAKNHWAKMEGVQSGFKGAAGTTFQNISATSAGNHAQLAVQIAEQAKRAVLAETHAVTGDEEAYQAQASARSSTDGFAGTVNRPINV